MADDEFGQFSLPDESMQNPGPGIDPGYGHDASDGSSKQEYERMMYEDPAVSGQYSGNTERPYDADSYVRSRRVQYSQEVQIFEKAKGGPVAKIGFIFGVAAAVMGLVFLGGFLADEALSTGGLFSMLGCWLGLLGGLFSVAGIVLCIVGLAMGAGLNRGKAIFGLIFSVLYWVMLGMEFALAVFIVAASTQPEIFLW